MPVDPGELVDPLKRNCNPPGQDLHPDASDDDWVGYLLDAFWVAKLNGVYPGYTVNTSELIVPISGTEDMPRDLQQLIVLFASVRVLESDMRGSTGQTVFRAQAGPVSFETQQSAQVLRELLTGARNELKELVNLIGTSSIPGAGVSFLDTFIIHETNMAFDSEFFVRD